VVRLTSVPALESESVVQKGSPDQIDLRLLELLQEDGRRPYAELGTAVGISGPAAHERVKKLESRGLITGFGARVAADRMGFGILAFTWVTQAPGTVATDLTGDFGAIGEIEECHHIAGAADYLLKVRARDTHDLERIVRLIQGTRHVSSTETDVVFSTAFERRPIRPGPPGAG
jgi:Lrp/AsnC family transcriptional regulator, leucine-responsive regulatory protein